MSQLTVILFLMFGMGTVEISAHGRLMEPPARNAMWRFGFPNPVNYNDNELFCGGYAGLFLIFKAMELFKMIVSEVSF